MKLGVDLDGVLFDWSRAFGRKLNAEFDQDLPVDDPTFPRKWDWRQLYGIPEKVWSTAVAGLTPDWWIENVQPYDPEELWLLNELPHEVVFLTARGSHPESPLGRISEDQLEWWGVVEPQVLITGPHKAPMLRTLGIEAFIDDSPEVLWECVTARVPTKLFVRDQPWNREGVPREARRVSSVRAFLKIL